MPRTLPPAGKLPHLSSSTTDTLLALLLLLLGLATLWIESQVVAEKGASSLLLLCAGCLVFTGFLIVSYAAVIEPRLLILTKRRVLSALPAGLRIAIIGDLHVGPFKGASFVARIVRRTLTLAPDLILLPGDFLFDGTADINLLRPLSGLRAPLGVYAVMGNHDSGCHFGRQGEPLPDIDRTAELTACLTSLGISVLRNASTILEHHGKRFAVAGIDDLWNASCDIPSTISRVPDELPLLLLSHQPDVILNPATTRADLVVAGHTHGGQVRLPFIGPLTAIPSHILGRRYDQGLFSLRDGKMLAITHGTGESMARVRFCAPPEIMLIETI